MAAALTSVERARELAIAATRRLGDEEVAIESALDRTLSRDLLATGDVPPFPCSAMDGYAVQPGPAARALEVVGESRAGAPFAGRVEGGQAVRISTGAAVPEGADAVIRQEEVEISGSSIRTLSPLAPDENVRATGEDMRAGATVLRGGTVLCAAEIGAAVAAGAGEVLVVRRPEVAVLSTGDELKPPGAHLGPGEIHNSNAPVLAALSRRCGARVTRVERLADDRERTEAALAGTLAGADLVVISGGVSVGPHDHVKAALASLGVVEIFWGVALQPGKPTWFGRQDGKLVFGLPGNPVSAVVTFTLFAAPVLAALQGRPPSALRHGEAILGHPVRQNPGREQAVRVRLERPDSRVIAHPNGPQGSHLLSSLLGADALALIPPGEGELAAGSPVALADLLN